MDSGTDMGTLWTVMSFGAKGLCADTWQPMMWCHLAVVGRLTELRQSVLVCG